MARSRCLFKFPSDAVLMKEIRDKLNVSLRIPLNFLESFVQFMLVLVCFWVL